MNYYSNKKEELLMKNIQEVWDAIMVVLKNDPTLSDAVYSAWFTCIKPVAIEGDTLVLSVEGSLQKQMIEKFSVQLEAAIEATVGFPLEPVIRAEEEEQAKAEDARHDALLRRDLSSYYTMINAFYTFDTFIVGPTSDLAYYAAQAVAKQVVERMKHPDQFMFQNNSNNPLFIWGGSGLGKTHLLHAICNEVHRNVPDAKLLYTTCDSFVNDYMDAMNNKTWSEFRQKYRDVNLLLIDDIQFLQKKEQMQVEFFNTFEAITNFGGYVVLTSDRRPNEIATLTDRLRSRFERGMLADIQPPPIETRLLIVQTKVAALNFHMDKRVCEYIARELKTNVRQIEGVINRLHGEYLLAGTVPNEKTAEIAISNVRNSDQPVSVTVERIISEVARTMDVNPDDIRSKGGNAQIRKARKVAAYIIREITRMKTKEIGNEFGGLDHSTISYATANVEAKMKSDSDFKQMVEDILNNLKNEC